MNLRRASLVSALALVAIFAIVGTAGATQTKKIDSHIKITKTQPKFKGKVSATNKACIADRRVRLYAVEAGNEVVGTAKTNNKGRWKINFQGEGAGLVHYYAKVLRSVQGTAGTIYVCKHDRTPNTTQAARGGRPHAARAGTVYDTDLRLSAKFPAFHGRVKSESDLCLPGRKVRVFKKRPGEDKKLGSDVSDEKGRWKFKFEDLTTAAYYAKVGQLKNPMLDFRCKSAKSNVVAAD